MCAAGADWAAARESKYFAAFLKTVEQIEVEGQRSVRNVAASDVCAVNREESAARRGIASYALH